MTRKSKAIYWTVRSVSCIALMVLAPVVAGGVYNLLGIAARPADGSFGLTAVLSVAVSPWIAIAVCRRLGIDAYRRDARTIPDPAAGVSAASPLSPAVDLHAARSAWHAIALAMTVLTALFALLVALLPAKSGTEPYGWLIVGFFALCAGGAWYAGRSGRGFIARADEAGILYYPGFRPRILPWEDIAACEVVTLHLPAGDRVLLHVKDARGKVLTSLSLTEAKEDRREPFLDYVAAKLSRRRWWRDGTVEGA